MPDAFLSATTEDGFRAEVRALSERDDFTEPGMGWPWPWETSHMTDYAYAFDDGHVWASGYGGPWFRADQPEPDDMPDDMDGVGKYVTHAFRDTSTVTFGKRSGLMVLSGGRLLNDLP